MNNFLFKNYKYIKINFKNFKLDMENISAGHIENFIIQDDKLYKEAKI